MSASMLVSLHMCGYKFDLNVQFPAQIKALVAEPADALFPPFHSERF